jgi:hypothetical protein
MPYSSMEIAQMNGAFQQASMQQQQYSGMIGQGYGGGSIYGVGSGATADRMMGGAMNRMGAVGAPLMAGAAGLMGMDPLSLGLKAGIGAYGAGMGLGGAAAVGGAVALPAMAAFGAGSYMGHQAYQGAGQQMDLNATLRSSYNFRNQQGGAGFQRGEMTQIGSMIRDMSGQFGPGGEVVGFRELTQLAGKMNTMGLAQGVKDVKDFAEKFKHMVTSLKTMATDLGTTLEGAMEFAAAAKSSGVFGMKNAAGFAHAARQTAASGGLAVSEVTGAASIGSQISRAMGGLGRQGAAAGMRTIGQIGTAVQMGAITEEDIYNTTGLTGAEGRQAYATSSMEKTASFLQSGRGRRMLASMAGKNGTLDESAVQEFLSGGMSIQETMRLDNKMKSTVGRANFIRNEGRLRGAAMERLGAFLPGIQMQQWAASKGIDINDMDDRSMLFAQRQLGMGRDEVDSAIKMANAMPRIMEEQRRSDVRDQGQQQFALMSKGRGLEGVKTRYEQAKHEINSKLQKVGQDFFNQGSEWVEGIMNRMIDNYSQNVHKDIDSAFQDMLGGGAIGRGAGQRVFGLGGNNFVGQRKGTGAINDILGGEKGSTLAERMTQGTEGGAMDSLKNTLFGSPMDIARKGGIGEYLRHGQSGVAQMKLAGFDIAGKSSEQMAAKFADISKMQGIAAQSAAQGANLGSNENSKWIRDAYAMDKSPDGGDERLDWFGKQLARNNPAAGDAWNKRMSQADKVAYMAKEEARAGITGGGALGARYGVPEKLAGAIANIHGSGFATTGEMNTAYAKAFGYESEWDKRQKSALTFQANILGIDKAFYNLTHGDEATKNEAKGAFVKSEEFRDLAEKLLSSDQGVAEKAQAALGSQLGSIAAGGHTDADDVKTDMLKASTYASMKQRGASQKDLEDFARSKGTTVDELEGRVQGMIGVVQKGQRENRLAMARTAGAAAKEDLMSGQRAGLYDAASGKLSAATRAELLKAGGTAAVALAESGMAQTQRQSGLSGSEGADPSNQFLFGQLQAGADEQGKLLEKMTVPQMRAVAQTMAGTPIGSIAGRSAAMITKLEAGNRRGGANKTLAGILGVGVQGDLKTQEGADRVAELYAQSSGIKDEPTIKMIHEAVNAARKGDVRGEEKALRSVVESSSYSDAQKKKASEEDEQKNPLQAAIKKNTEDTAHAITKLVERGVKVMNVQEFVAAQMQDVEEKAKGASDKNAGKSGR